MITIDFETKGIVGSTVVNPPEPVGVAIKYNDDPAEYFPIDSHSIKVLHDIWDSNQPMLFQNGWLFDLCVASKWLGLPFPSWERVHDTMYLTYLHDPYSKTLSLKPTCENILGWDTGDRDELRDWVMVNVPEAKASDWGAYMWKAPLRLLSKYGAEDANMTKALFDHLYPLIPKAAYDRERELAPILMDMSRRGVRADVDKLAEDLPQYEQAYADAQQLVYDIVGDINLASPIQLANALEERGLVDPDAWILTAKGGRSTSKVNLRKVLKDQTLLDTLAYQGSLKNALDFMRGWHTEAANGDGHIHTTWNQVRNDQNDTGAKGTRTGRVSSSGPNLANVAKAYKDQLGRAQAVPAGLLTLPLCRQYLLPDEGQVWGKRDWNGQEFRIMAHFEDGQLMEAYKSNPLYDAHSDGTGMIEEITGVLYARPEVKITGFSIIYGSGIPGLSSQLGRAPNEARAIKNAYIQAFPGIEKLAKATKKVGQSGQAIKTWGGRFYHVEPPKIVDGSMREFHYKLLNYLIQGSAADQCKQVIIDWHKHHKLDGSRMLTQVYDELNCSFPEDWKPHMAGLKKAMEQDYFDVPMVSEGLVGPNWADMEDVE